MSFAWPVILITKIVVTTCGHIDRNDGIDDLEKIKCIFGINKSTFFSSIRYEHEKKRYVENYNFVLFFSLQIWDPKDEKKVLFFFSDLVFFRMEFRKL